MSYDPRFTVAAYYPDGRLARRFTTEQEAQEYREQTWELLRIDLEIHPLV